MAQSKRLRTASKSLQMIKRVKIPRVRMRTEKGERNNTKKSPYQYSRKRQNRRRNSGGDDSSDM